jgi:hypothetical protein
MSSISKREINLINRLNTPEKVQRYLNRYISYDGGPTIKSFRRVLKTKKAHCLEGALFAAAILQHHNYSPLILCMEARDMDHIIFIYKDVNDDRWGAVSQAEHKEMKGREAKFTTIRDLVMDYYPHYFNMYSKKPDKETDITLRGYNIVDLEVFEFKYPDWILQEEELEIVNSYLYDIPYRWLFPKDENSLFYRCDDKGVITNL